jgi:hypothetical protein
MKRKGNNTRHPCKYRIAKAVVLFLNFSVLKPNQRFGGVRFCSSQAKFNGTLMLYEPLLCAGFFYDS